MNRSALIVLVGVLAQTLMSCSDSPHFDHLYYTNVSTAPGEVSLRPNEIRIARGLAARAHVDAVDSDGAPMERPDLRSSDTSVFGADPGPSSGEFVFYGVATGSAELDVYSNGGFEGSLPVTVLAP